MSIWEKKMEVVGKDTVLNHASLLGANVNSRDWMGGVVIRITFDNGFGISVAQHNGSYGGDAGCWEVAPLRTDGDLMSMPQWDDDFEDRLPREGEDRALELATGVVGDQVAGHLEVGQVLEMMDSISEINPVLANLL